MDGRDLKKTTRIHVCYDCLVFSSLVRFCVLPWVNWGVFSPLVLFRVFLTLFTCYLSIRLFCYILFVTIFCSKIVWFPCYPVVGIFSSLFWNVLFCLCCFILSRYLLNFPFLASTFWFISSSCIVCFDCVLSVFSSLHVPEFFFCLILFACCRRFLICISSLISHPAFEFLFCSILSQINFALA